MINKHHIIELLTTLFNLMHSKLAGRLVQSNNKHSQNMYQSSINRLDIIPTIASLCKASTGCAIIFTSVVYRFPKRASSAVIITPVISGFLKIASRVNI